MGSTPLSTPRGRPPTGSRTWRPACSAGQNRGAFNGVLAPTPDTLHAGPPHATRHGCAYTPHPDPVSREEESEEPERLSGSLLAFRGVLRMVGASCCSAAVTDRTGLPAPLRSLARSASRDPRSPACATHAF